MRRPLTVLGAIAALAASGCSSGAASVPTTSVATVVDANASVVRVVDGDTVVVDIGDSRETVRLIGIDTPETVKPDSPVECFGPEASAFTQQLLPDGTAVRVERDVEARDDYGRLLVYLYRADDGTFVNLHLVEQGYATLLTFPPNIAHVEQFVQAAQAAQQANLGLWAGCTG